MESGSLPGRSWFQSHARREHCFPASRRLLGAVTLKGRDQRFGEQLGERLAVFVAERELGVALGYCLIPPLRGSDR